MTFFRARMRAREVAQVAARIAAFMLVAALASAQPPPPTGLAHLTESRPAAAPAEPADGPIPTDPLAARRAESAAFRAAAQGFAPYLVRITAIGGAEAIERGQTRSGETIARPEFRQGEGPTTGVIWSADGLIITSDFAFLREPPVIIALLADGRRLAARLVARDSGTRLAVLRVAASDLPLPPRAALHELSPGQWTIALGFGHDAAAPTVSVGVLSATRRLLDLAVQTDAKISPANYGGPLLTIDGRLIGVCVATAGADAAEAYSGVDWYDSGIGFAIRAEQIERRLPQLLEHGSWTPGVLGVRVRAADLAFGAADTALRGVQVQELIPGGPAEKIGLRPGAVILALAGTATPRPIDFKRALAMCYAGQRVRMRYAQDWEIRSAEIELVAPQTLTPSTAPAPTGPLPESAPIPLPLPAPPAKPGLGR